MTKSKLESEDEVQLASLTKHDLVGDLIYGTIMSYFALNDIQKEIQTYAADMVAYRLPSYGVFNTTIKPDYWFGIPTLTRLSGLSMDVDSIALHRVAKDNDQAKQVSFTQASGSRWSAMEHLVPEQMFSTEEAPAQGISAVKALAIAAQEGQRIYTITQDNLEEALAGIELNTSVEQEIRYAANAGLVVTTHEANIVFGNWIGAGYILIDPETGAGSCQDLQLGEE